MEEAIQQVTPEKWTACVQHVIEQEEVMMCSLYCLMEETVEQPIINVND
jgi:hypothetical protein